MRKKLFSICISALAFCVPQQVLAQKNENANHEDSYYLKGAVPTVNGKVVFSKEYSIAGMSKDEVYAKTKEWMDVRMHQNANKSRLAYENEEKGQLAANGEEYIVFSNSALALDRTKVMYQMTANCDEGKCVLQIKNIRYDYPNEKEIYVAEDWISDEVALTKDQSRLARGFAKWRRKTVDFVDDMNESLQKALSGFGIVRTDGRPEETRKSDAVAVVDNRVTTVEVETVMLAEVKPESEVPKPVVKAAAPDISPNIPLAEATKSFEAAKVVDEAAKVEEATKVEEIAKPVEEKLKPLVEAVKVEETVNVEEDDIEGETIKSEEATKPKEVTPQPVLPVEVFPELTADKIQASNGRLVIIIGEDEFNRTTMTANAGGYLSSRDGKKFINTILTPDQNYQTLVQAKEYMVAFYPEGTKEPSVVMKCMNVTKEKPDPGHANIFVGEIKSVETR